MANQTSNMREYQSGKGKTTPKYITVDLTDLKPYEQNVKKHPKWQIKQIAESIEHFQCINPLIISDSFEIIAGHGRYEAAKHLGLSKVPAILVNHLSEAEIKAYRIADNKLNMSTGFDLELLTIELNEIQDLDLDFDLQLTGHFTGELDVILNPTEELEDASLEEIPEAPENPITKLGDLWLLGNHRLYCGNSLEKESYETLMGGEKAHAIFTDPPFNVAISGHVCGSGKIKHEEFAMASGEMSEDEFKKFLSDFLEQCVDFSHDGSLHYICMDWRSIDLLMTLCRSHYRDIKNVVIWNKSNGGMGSMYRSKHEMIVVCKNGTATHTNNVQLGKHGRYRSNVWDYPGVNSFSRSNDLKLHPTVKPTAMVADAVMDCTHLNDIVLDPFAGSGSTLLACEKTGRKARCIELEPKYCDVIIKRWQEQSGQEAIHAADEQSFNHKSQTQGE